MYLQSRQDTQSDDQRQLAIGLGAGLGGLFVLSLFAVVLWTCVQRRKLRESVIELESGDNARRCQRQNETTILRLSSFLRSGPNDEEPQIVTSTVRINNLSEKAHRSASARLSRPTSTIPQTQFEIEIGNHGKFRNLRLKRLRSQDDNEDRPCRRKLSKRNLKAVDRPDPMPARLLVEESDHNDMGSGDAGVSTQHEHLCLDLERRSSSVSPERFTRVAAVRTRSASAILPRSFSSTIAPDLGTERPVLHNRSLSYGAGCIGPAPVGPLPPLPQIAKLRTSLSVQSRYRRSITSPTKSLLDKGEKLQSPRPVSNAISVCSNLSKWCIPTQSAITQSDAHVAHSQSASVNTWRSSVSPSGSNRRVSFQSQAPSRRSGSVRNSRLPSAGRLSPRNSFRSAVSPIAKITPQRQLQARVSFLGSPAQRRRGVVLPDVSGNALPERYLHANSQGVENAPRSTSSSPARKRSALKSPDSLRKGHRRQNCVRISTLPPVIFGEGVSSNSLLDGILEESPGSIGRARVPVMRISAPMEQTSFRPALSPRNHTEPVKWRASLTPSSPTLSMSRFEQDGSWHTRANPFTGRGAFTVVQRDRSADLLSIPSLPSFGSHLGGIDDRTPTPTIELTRPSGEYDPNKDGFPFDFDFQESPVQPRKFDDTDMSWSPPPVGSAVDVEQTFLSTYGDDDWPQSALRMTNITVAASASSSSLEFPFADGGDPTTCSDPLDAHSDMRVPIQAASSFPVSSFKAHRLASTSAWAPSLAPGTTTRSPLFSHPPTKVASQPLLNHSTTDPNAIFAIHTSHRPSISSAPAPAPLRPIPSTPRPTLPNRVSGPRSAPAKDLRRSIMQLRRMNSDVHSTISSQSRRYMKLGREASPMLPFTFGSFPVFDEGDGESLLSDQDADVGFQERGLWEKREEGDKGNWHCGSADGLGDEGRLVEEEALGKAGAGLSFDFRFEFPCPATSSSYPVPIVEGVGAVEEDILRELEDETIRAERLFGRVEEIHRSSGVEVHRRGSSVWEDGEAFWSSPAAGIGCIDGAGELYDCDSKGIISDGFVTGKGGKMSMREIEELLGIEPSTPTETEKEEGRVRMQVQATPGSLYDGQGFLVAA
ncbi:Hypothetical protein D9617_3g021950 [Elsinoe fawcettii]|nr:Hypothetical protein D9617_3g021950 [Elsinoe fawcettii]